MSVDSISINLPLKRKIIWGEFFSKNTLICTLGISKVRIKWQLQLKNYPKDSTWKNRWKVQKIKNPKTRVVLHTPNQSPEERFNLYDSLAYVHTT